MTTPKPQHGGPRPNSGRPKLDSAKRAYSTRFTPEVIEYLKTLDNAAETLESLVRGSKAFKARKPANRPRM